MTVYINGTTGYSGPVGTIGDLTTTGNTTLGDASGDTLTLNGNTASIPNGLNFTNGNIGIGVTPSAWGGTYKGLDISSYTSVYGATGNDSGLTQNSYYNGTNWLYRNANAATRYLQSGGQHQWLTATSGSVGGTVSWTTAMTLDASGNLGLGVTPSAWSGISAVQFNNGSLSWSTNRNYINSNVYWNGSSWIRSTTGAANQFITSWYDNTFSWTSAVSGSAGTAATLLTKMTLDANGNLGVGVVPNSWGVPAEYRALQLGPSSDSMFLFGGGLLASLGYNAYWDGTNYKYANATSSYTLRYVMSAGKHLWYNAAAGTAGNNISWNQAMVLDVASNLGVGITSPDARVHVASSGVNRASTAKTESYTFYNEIQKTINDYRGVCDGTTGGYLLLVPAYPGSGLVSGKKFIGSVIADRGNEAAGNTVNYVHVVASTAYNSDIFLVKRDLNNQYFSAAAKVTYAGVAYLALKFNSTGGGPAWGIYLDGYHRGTDSNFFRLVLDSEVSSVNDAYGTISNNF